MDEPELLDQELERVALSVGIPPRPGVLIELSAEAKKDEPDFQHIEKRVSADVGLSAALFKTINSPFYGLRNKATTVKQAINLLGLSALLRMITGMALRNSFAGTNQISMERFWDASAKVALVTSYIAKQLPGMIRDEAYTFGLFQDCGIPVLMQRFPAYKETLGLANQSVSRKFTEIEDEIHGTNHATIGFLLAKSWRLPETVTKAIRFHHEHAMLVGEQDDLPVESQNLVALALLAERAIQLHSGRSQTAEWVKGGPLVLAHLGLSDAEFNEIEEEIKQILDKDTF
ncbi:MAG: HDOD domain-containing protein [Burkholderiales bacterium]